MSGPVSTVDTPAAAVDTDASPPCLEIVPSREASAGPLRVRRALPRRERRTVGAWCFLDHFGPVPAEESGLEIGPHPHIGLHTVTWLVEGETLHRDSLGTEQPIRAGQLNLMTAGRGVSHSEEAVAGYSGPVHGVQLWLAQPEATRHGEPAFEHHAALPQVELGAATGTVLVGSFAGTTSPARVDTPLLGLDLDLRPGTGTLPLRGDYEHALVVLDGALRVGTEVVRPGSLAYLGLGSEELPLTATEPTRALLVGGVPFPEPVLIWWNFVARTREEVSAAYDDWRTGSPRFGRVASPLDPIPAPPPRWPRTRP